jgi:hypothetical protein
MNNIETLESNVNRLTRLLMINKRGYKQSVRDQSTLINACRIINKELEEAQQELFKAKGPRF